MQNEKAFKIIYNCGEKQYIKCSDIVESANSNWIEFLEATTMISFDGGAFYRRRLSIEQLVSHEAFAANVVHLKEVEIEEFNKAEQLAIDYQHLLDRVQAI